MAPIHNTESLPAYGLLENETIFENAPLVMFLVDENARMARLNKAAVQISGRASEAECIGLPGGQALRCVNGLKDPQGCGFGPDCQTCVIRKTVLDTLATGRAHQAVEAPLPYDGEDGVLQLWVLMSTSLVTLPQGKQVLVCLKDITRHKQLESRLQLTNKMESIGTLAGGIAHDFNNILSIILGNAELALSGMNHWHPAQQNLKEIRTATLRAKRIVRQLLSFSDRANNQLAPMPIAPVITESLQLLRSTLPATIEIKEVIHLQQDCILADPAQIKQMMVNLGANAAQAMDTAGGTLEVKLDDLAIDPSGCAGNPDLSAGDYVRLTVGDTGRGMDPQIIASIFDPYFTTREVGQGSGMGLAVVHGIVKNIGGTITAVSQPGHGSTFTILIPKVDGPSAGQKDSPSAMPMGTGSILFVDDEGAIVEMMGEMLTRLGYQVETKLNPQEALALFQAQPDRFDLVITDMTMPQMTGTQLASQVKAIREDIPIIICTGYSDQMDGDKATQMGFAGYLMKPMVMGDIARTIKDVLS